MAAWCLVPKAADAFLEAIKSGVIDPAKLMDMTSAERREAFAKIVGADNARELNAEFESKLLLKDQQRGLVNWVKKTAGLTEPARRDILARIEKMDRILDPEDEKAFLADLAAKKLGTDVTPEEARNILELSRVAEAARNAGTNAFSGVSDEFLNATENLKSYISSLKPVSTAKSIGMNAAVIARNNLLMNPSTPIKTMIGQGENMLIEAAMRRIGNMSVNGLNGDLAKAARAEAWETYKRTGLNTAGMETLNDTGKLGEGLRFDVHGGASSTNALMRMLQQGIHRAALISNKVIIDWAHVAPFNRVYQQAFFDMANIVSSNLARGEGLAGEAARARAEEIFRDAAKVEPKTQEGAMVRQLSQQQSARVTSTNETVASRMAMGVKDALNKAVFGLGDAIMPIAKIPANIIWNGIENAGVGIPLGVRDIFQGRAKIQSAEMVTRYEGMAQYAKGIQTVARTVGTVSAAMFFASQMTAGDFRKDRYGESYVKIGDVWINMEYVSAISPALAGAMSSKMDTSPDQTIARSFADYVAGAASALKRAPGVHEVADLVDSVSNAGAANGFKKYADTFFTSRAVPAFIANLFKDRPIDRLFFGAHGVESTEAVATDRLQSQMARGPGGLSIWGGPMEANINADPVNRELERLNMAPGFPAKKIRGVPLTDAQYTKYVQLSGSMAHVRLEEMAQMSGLDAMPLSMQRDMVRDTIRQSRDMAAMSIMLESQGSNNDIMAQATAAKMATMQPTVP